jgi:hypothetical protein
MILFLCFMGLFGFNSAQAQVGASTSPVLIESTVPPTHEAVLNGRYEIKKQKPTGLPSKNLQRNDNLLRNSSIQRSAGQDPAAARKVQPQRIPASEEVLTKSETAAPEQKAVAPSAENPVTTLDPEDIRFNRMEIQASPTMVYNGSGSNYSFRSYSSFFSAVDLSSNVWMTQNLGLYGRIMFSFGASLPGDSSTSSRIPVKYEDLDLALKFRQFFSQAKDSQSIEFALLYSEDKLSPPSDNTFRPRLLSSGFGARLTSRIPTSGSFAWVFGGSFYPRLLHKEEQVGIPISSGGPDENTRWGFSIGNEVKFSRGNQIIYDLAISTERDSFNGQANPLDPDTGKAPSNVIVTNTMVQFGFGYRWGR